MPGESGIAPGSMTRRGFLGAAAGTVVVVLTLGMGLPAASAWAQVSVTRVSDESPFADHACLSAIDAKANGDDAHGLETNPAFGWSSTGPIAAWDQDGSLGIVAAYRTTAGAWRQTVPPGISVCAPGPRGGFRAGYDARATLPTMVVDGAGVALVAAQPRFPDPRGDMMVSTSSDGGANWSLATPVSLPVQTPTSLLSASGDPTNPHAFVMTWATPFTGQTWFVRSTDDGRIWSPALPIHEARPGTAEGPAVVTLPDGTEVIVEWNQPFTSGPTESVTGCGGIVTNPNPCETKIYALRSTDHGLTWKRAPIVTLPDLNWLTESVNVTPMPTIGPGGSANVLIPFDHAGARTWRIYRSYDGAHWRDIGITVPLGHTVFPYDMAPSLALTAHGAIGVLYADHRLDDQPNQPCPQSGKECRTDEWLSYSTDQGANWNTVHLGGPFDLNTVPSNYIGDLEDLHALGDSFGAVFALGACQRPFACAGGGATKGADDIFFATLAP